MRRFGWEVVGVEPDEKAVQFAHEKFSLKIFHGVLEEANFQENSFDAVTLNHVIEHVPDPVKLLRECWRVLKPNGKLILVTPNIKSLGHRVFGKNWRGLEVPRHLFIFSRQSLRTCAELAGVKIQELRTSAKGARGIWSASYLVRKYGVLSGGRPERQNILLIMEGIVFWLIEYFLAKIKDAGEELVLCAIK